MNYVERAEQLISEQESYLDNYYREAAGKFHQAFPHSDKCFDEEKDLPPWYWEQKMKLAELYLLRAYLEVVHR